MGSRMTDFSLFQALSTRRTIREFNGGAIPFQALIRLLWAAYGETDQSGKRTAPSAHGLSPIRLRVSTGNVDGMDTGVFSVGDDGKSLSPVIMKNSLAQLESAAIGDQPWVGSAACVITVCADFITPTRDFSDQEPLGQRGA